MQRVASMTAANRRGMPHAKRPGDDRSAGVSPSWSRARRLVAVLAPVLLVWLTLGTPAAGALPAPTIPTWVKKGLVLQYREEVDNDYIGEDITDTVTAVAAGEVHFTIQTRTVGAFPDPRTYARECSASGSCPLGAAGYQFFIDPANPLASVSGEHLPIEYLGVHEIKDDVTGETWKVGELYYANTALGIGGLTYFQTGTGLVEAHGEWADHGAYNVIYWYYS